MKVDRKQKILIVDDSMLNRALLADMIGDTFETVEAEDGQGALAILQREGTGISLVLLDYVMPVMSGFDVLEVMNQKGLIKDIPVIMVSAESDPAYVERAYELGVTDFINRPFDANIVRRRVMNTLTLYEKQRTLVGLVADQVYEREKTSSLMVYILSHIVEFRNGESGLHVLNVSTMTEMILNCLVRMTDRYELTPDDISLIAMASSLHDIGKIAIPEEVLNKPGRLTDEEFAIMKTHAAAGSDMLDNLQFYKDEKLVKVAREICRWHHERYDGHGYPDGLVGDDIPISAQVVALADVYDALTSPRVYKAAFSHEKALSMIRNGECGTFNPLIIECLGEVADELETHLNQGVPGLVPTAEAGSLFNSALAAVDSEASSRTLELLDYERVKYQFFASMSNEVQFEFNVNPPMIVLSDWSEQQLGLPEIIMNPMEDPAFLSVFDGKVLRSYLDQMYASDPSDPIIKGEMVLTIDGKPRWFHMTVQTIFGGSPEKFQGAIGKLVDIDERQNQLRDLQLKAYHDPLTKAMNRSFAQKTIEERMASRPDNTFAMIVADLDWFKRANDERGHQFGDRVLREFAERLMANVRGDDVVARVGGDEFLLFVRCPHDLRDLIERIHRAAQGELDGFPLTASLGVAVATPDVRDFDELFREADLALYHVKNTGRGGYALYDDLPEEERRWPSGKAPTAISAIDGK